MSLACAYVRVSRVGGRGTDDTDFLSPALQISAARNLCALHGWELDEALTESCMDLDVSGWRGRWQKRPGLNRLLQAARAGQVSHIIVYKLSRLARSAKEGLEIFDAAEAAGASIHVVREGIDTSTAVGRLIRTILLAVAEMQAEDISTFARDAARERAKAGRAHRLPAWIVKTETGYELDPVKSSTVRRLVELRLAGHSYGKVAGKLNAEGHRSMTGGLWRGANVGQFLSPILLRRLVGESVFGVDLPEGSPDRVVIPKAFPPLISQDELDALLGVQAALEASPLGADGRKRGRARHSPYLASGLVYCSVCGLPLHIVRQSWKTQDGDQAAAWVCNGPAETGIPHPVRGRSMSEDGQRVSSTSAELVDAALLRAMIAVLEKVRG